MKKLICLIFTVLMAVTSIVPSFAIERSEAATTSSAIHETDSVEGGQFGDVYYRKKDVTNSYAWSESARVSDNLSGSVAGGTISTNRTKTFDIVLSGGTQGLSFSGSTSITSELGYTLNVPAGRTGYIAFRCYYRIERGTRETVSSMTGQVIATTSYTAKIPQHGAYHLVSWANT